MLRGLTRLFRDATIGLTVCMSILAGSTTLAQQQPFANHQQEVLYEQLLKELRCLVCQNQNLADSSAGLAKDLKKKTREMVIAGKSYDEVVSYMTDRYGDFVLYRPPVNRSTIMLWLGPFLLLVVATMVVFWRTRNISRQTDAGREVPVENQETLSRARSLMQDDK